MKIEKGATYSLNELDIKTISDMAKRMDEQNRDYYINHLKRDKKSTAYESYYNGFAAELAFCRMAKVDFNSSTENTMDTFIKPDCLLPDGRSVDVKGTSYNTGRLLVRIGKEKGRKNQVVDLFVLLTGNPSLYVFKGWISYPELIKEENILNLGYGDNYASTQDKLHPILDF